MRLLILVDRPKPRGYPILSSLSNQHMIHQEASGQARFQGVFRPLSCNQGTLWPLDFRIDCSFFSSRSKQCRTSKMAAQRCCTARASLPRSSPSNQIRALTTSHDFYPFSMHFNYGQRSSLVCTTIALAPPQLLLRRHGRYKHHQKVTHSRF